MHIERMTVTPGTMDSRKEGQAAEAGKQRKKQWSRRTKQPEETRQAAQASRLSTDNCISVIA